MGNVNNCGIIDLKSLFDEDDKREQKREQSITWDFLVMVDPYFDELLKEINRLDKTNINTTHAWYKVYKPKIITRVGFGAPVYALDLLKTSKAYTIVYRKLCDALCGEGI